ncbi:hypothetical protein ONE63_007260 [Megalurothrips usitatus]|uniref:Zinc finger CCCH domain-containing protein 14 n=1 Tax=Megalurothrips usitatus TaxID=439358 RepID=A0AAV7XXX6_9NEOP|nr:hypothetical protein ONE63_007260 [Megalurothrips usitatus]
MDGIRGEVSNKIRSAIKAKLMELGAYVDDELPDYIMVMVANKRSRQQMEDDLQLFLGDSTSAFTSWLHTVLSKLQQVTVNSSELKKGSDKKRLPTEDHKKEKRKKLKKEKGDTPEKSPEKPKAKEKVLTEKGNDPVDPQPKIKLVKSEPVDIIVDAVPPPTASTQSSEKNRSGTQHKKSSDSKVNDEDDDDDFINLKADVEGEMWGEAEETTGSAVRSSTASELKTPAATSRTKLLDANVVETVSESSKHLKPISSSSSSLPTEAVSTSVSTSSAKTAAVDPKPAPRIIRISETIREEQETLKPASKVVRDPQALAKRVFQSHIVSQRNIQDREDKSRKRSSSSLASENRTRRSDHRSVRKHEQPDLRETLRKERQKERENERDRERGQRRSREQSRGRKTQTGVSSVARSSSSHRDENDPDPALASVVRVKPRPQIPAALQANRSLILKAVAEAQKSVSKVVVRSVLPNSLSPTKQQPVKKSVKDRLQTRQQPNAKISPLSKKQAGRLPSRETLRKMSFTVHAKKSEQSNEPPGAEFGEVSDDDSIILDPSLNILIQVPSSPAVEESHGPPDPIKTEKVRRWIKDVEEATKSDTVGSGINTGIGTEAETFEELESSSKHASDEDSGEFDDALEVDTTSLKTSDIHSVVISEDQTLKQASATQFVVTLDGLDPMLLRSFALESDQQVHSSTKQQTRKLQDESNQEDEENLLRDELVKEQLLRQELLRQQAAIREQKAGQRPTIAVPPVAAPVNAAIKRPASPSSPLETRPPKVLTAVGKSLPAERCKFWPSCKNGDKCEFHHPSVPCKLFPNCKFSDRCLYIHPNCRYNTGCTRTDCPYTHSVPRSGLSSTTTGTTCGSHLGNQPIKQACKYFPNCSNLSCPFIHPTVCKFGTHCTKPKCQFIHSDKGLITKHKWVRH